MVQNVFWGVQLAQLTTSDKCLRTEKTIEFNNTFIDALLNSSSGAYDAYP